MIRCPGQRGSGWLNRSLGTLLQWRPTHEEVTMGDALVTSQRLADGAAIIDVRGELDVTTVSAFRALLVETIKREQPAHVVVDMLHVTFMDSTGIGALVIGYNTAREIGADFVVRNPSTFVLRQLHITGLTEVFGLPAGGQHASTTAYTPGHKTS
jgi:anti-sigma B factor antagonist